MELDLLAEVAQSGLADRYAPSRSLPAGYSIPAGYTSQPPQGAHDAVRVINLDGNIVGTVYRPKNSGEAQARQISVVVQPALPSVQPAAPTVPRHVTNPYFPHIVFAANQPIGCETTTRTTTTTTQRSILTSILQQPMGNASAGGPRINDQQR